MGKQLSRHVTAKGLYLQRFKLAGTTNLQLGQHFLTNFTPKVRQAGMTSGISQQS